MHKLREAILHIGSKKYVQLTCINCIVKLALDIQYGLPFDYLYLLSSLLSAIIFDELTISNDRLIEGAHTLEQGSRDEITIEK